MERRVCPQADMNVVCSDLDGERLAEIVPGVAWTNIANGVDLDYFTRRSRPGSGRRLVFAGDLTWYPNIDAMKWFVASIWPRLKGRIDGLELWVAGRGEVPELDAAAGADPAIRVLGYVDDVREVIEAADVYVCPIRDGGGTKLKVLDALAMEIPLVADPIACEGIDVVDGDSVLFARTPDEWVHQIERLLATPELADRLRSRGRQLIEKEFSYAVVGARLRRLYRDLVAAKSS
jgi:glycosyltransferase involved in cell wall biosynthesis